MLQKTTCGAVRVIQYDKPKKWTEAYLADIDSGDTLRRVHIIRTEISTGHRTEIFGTASEWIFEETDWPQVVQECLKQRKLECEPIIWEGGKERLFYGAV